MPARPETFRPAEQEDLLAITPERLHQYFRTVQSEEPAEAEIDAAMARRRARGLARRQRPRAALPWVVAGVLVLVLAGAWLLV